MKILIIGTGYVGLVTGACFAEIGHNVTCLDIDEKKIVSLKQGIVPFYEPGLEELVKKNINEQRLSFSCDYQQNVPLSDAIFLAVPTPSLSDGSCDLSFFFNAAETLAPYLKEYTVIVNKSTVPVGSADLVHQKIQSVISKNEITASFDVVSNPEFLKEGAAIEDFLHPDRIVIGYSSDKAKQLMEKIYQPLVDQGSTIFFMDPKSSELTKYAANAMLATRISFMNELSILCDKLGADIHHIKLGIGSDKRIGPSFLNAGIGYGGSCFPKDIKALRACADKEGVDLSILHAVDLANQKQKKHFVSMIERYFDQKGGLENKTIGIWGLSFKPETDDMREAPSLEIINMLLQRNVKIRAFDPISINTAKKMIAPSDNLIFCNDPYEACSGSDAVALITEWKHFSCCNMQEILCKMAGNAFFDGRNMLKNSNMKEIGFDYFGIGSYSLSSENSLQDVLIG